MTFKKLFGIYKNVKKIYDADESELARTMGLKTASWFSSFKRSFDPYGTHDEIQSKGITVITQEDPRYPPQFHHIEDPPICIYVKGDIAAYDFSRDFLFSVVGTRRPSSYGSTIAKQLASELAYSGMIIVSGMASGIDGEAHRGALEAGGRTIAVLGCGVDLPYPRSHRQLYQDILAGGGLIMSEFPPGHTVAKGLFINRNRLISGLSRGVLVVEGTNTSGALKTVQFAGDQGKDIFATPGQITSELSQAPHKLLRDGAVLVTSSNDILDEYDIKPEFFRTTKNYTLTYIELQVVKRLATETMSVDDLAQEDIAPVNSLMQLLSHMELRGILTKNHEGKYQIRS